MPMPAAHLLALSASLLLSISGCVADNDAARARTKRVSRVDALGWTQDANALIVRRVDQRMLGDAGTVNCDSTGLYVLRVDSIGVPASPRNTGARVCGVLWDLRNVVLSRDGRAVFVTGGRFALARLDLDLLEFTSIPAPCARYSTSLALHPTTPRIAFIAACTDERYGGLAMVDSNGSSFRLVGVPRDGTSERDPSWAPDGGRVALVQSRARGVDSVVVVDTLSATRTAVASGYTVAWSPSGEWLAYGSGQVLGLVRPDGRDNHTLLDFVGRVSHPRAVRLGPLVWSPDGRRIAFSQLGTLWVVGVSESAPHLVFGDTASSTIQSRKTAR